jgi:hypothetical protein
MGSIVEAPAARLPEVLQALESTPAPAAGVLSVYLDTGPASVQGQGYLIACRNGCKTVRSALSPDQRRAFKAAVTRVEGYLTGAFVPRSPGLALFASSEPSYFFAAALPHAPADHVTWGPGPRTEPLVAALDEFQRIAVLLFDKERARLFTVYLGRLEERRSIRDEVPGKQATGGWFALSQTRYARHHEEHVLRHVTHAVQELMDLLRERPFERLVVGGPDEAVALLRRHLPRPLQTRLAGSLKLELFASDSQVLEAALAAAESIEREHELERVGAVHEAANGRLAVLGIDETLAALADSRVRILIVAQELERPGAECPECRGLFKSGGQCPRCHVSLRPAASLREAAVERARAQGAEIEDVSGSAGRALLEHGGMAAWTRS